MVNYIFDYQRGHCLAVEGRQRVVKTLVPRGNPHADGGGKQRKADDYGQQQPFAPARFSHPKRAGKAEKLPDEFHGRKKTGIPFAARAKAA